jgi:nitrate reductase alpha subunit
MPKLVPVERDYAAVYRKWRSLGPLAEQLGSSAKGVALHPTVELDELRSANGEVDGRPSLARDVHMCEAILALSGVSN